MTMMPKVMRENLFDDWMNDFPFMNMMPAAPKMFGKREKNLMKTDVKETDKNYEIDMDLPGFKKDEIKAELNDGYLTISADRSFEKDEKNTEGEYIRRERSYGSCSRSFFVGDTVKEEDIKAKYENGILSLTIPKTEPEKLPPKTKQIAIEG